MRIAIVGGTFNPPHFGHLFFANEVRQKLKYDKIIFVPSSISAHKINDKTVSDTQRIEMLKLALEDKHWAEVSECDIQRGGITRTVDTISDIIKEYSLSIKPGFVIGDDLVKGFSNWKEPDKIASISDLIVGVRGESEIDLKYKYIPVNNRVFPLSSSEIRERVQIGSDIDFLLPEKVVKYIEINELYRSNK